jgi:hypothetical protein
MPDDQPSVVESGFEVDLLPRGQRPRRNRPGTHRNSFRSLRECSAVGSMGGNKRYPRPSLRIRSSGIAGSGAITVAATVRGSVCSWSGRRSIPVYARHESTRTRRRRSHGAGIVGLSSSTVIATTTATTGRFWALRSFFRRRSIVFSYWCVGHLSRLSRLVQMTRPRKGMSLRGLCVRCVRRGVGQDPRLFGRKWLAETWGSGGEAFEGVGVAVREEGLGGAGGGPA